MAQLAGCGVPGIGALRPGPRLHFMDNLDAGTYAGLLERLPLAATRFVAVSKSGGTGETLMQTIAALAAVRAAGLGGARAGALSRHHRARGRRPPQRPARPAWRRSASRCSITIRE